jgi:hypothetical protein
MLYLNNINQLEVKTYYKGCMNIGCFSCGKTFIQIQSIGESTVSVKYGEHGTFKDIPKQEVFDYINKGGYSDTPC